jgi:hypothetical protein
METASTGHAWIRQRSQPLLTQKKSMKIESVSTGKSSMKQIAKVTLGFISAPNETHFEGDAWIRQCP